MPPGLTKPVSEQPGATWKQHTNWEQHTNQTITHNSIIPKQCSETSHFPAPFHFLFTFPGVIRRPRPSGVQRNSQRLGKLPSLTLPHLRGSVCHGQLLSLHGHQKLLQSKGRRWFTINYYRKDSPFLSLEVPSPKTLWSSPSMAAGPRFKSQRQSSPAAPFPTPPTISYTCQHSLFFQLYWAAIVSLGRCGPMAWSQSSPSSHAGPVTRGSCFSVPSWVEVTPISLAQSRATAI